MTIAPSLRIFCLLGTLLFAGRSYGGAIRAADGATSVGDARKQIETNMATPEGKAYDDKIGAEFMQKHVATLRSCKKSAGGEIKNFWLLMKLDGNGKVLEILLYPESKLGACTRETLLTANFSPPPHAAYWVGIYLKLVS